MKSTKKIKKTAAAQPAAALKLSKAPAAELQQVYQAIAKIDFKADFSLKSLTAPVPGPLHSVDIPTSEPEPVYTAAERDDIQGNTIPGFNKDHQHFLFFRIKKPKPAQAFLKWIVPYLSSMEEVLTFRQLLRRKRLNNEKDSLLISSTWVNIAFSAPGITKLVGESAAAAFGDESFRQGLAARSTYLGDPALPSSSGHISKWRVGGPKNEADIIVTIAADAVDALDQLVKKITVEAAACGLELLFGQRGDNLPGDLRGHEHFGFKDGISQPGVRGKLSTRPGDYLTPRYIDLADNRCEYMAKPGQFLLWPGQFLLGEKRQSKEDIRLSAPAAANFPKWAARGSYLVVRRLRQNVPAFWAFAHRAAKSLGMPPLQFAATLVGRWPSGSPIMRSPAANLPALGEDGFANNHFIYDDDTRAIALRNTGSYPGDSFPPAMKDFLARVCPHFAHIRKMNPRDGASDLGKPADGFSHMLLRRGIPFGPPMVGVKNPDASLVKKERGLMFLSFGATIEDQFEFLQRRWANSPVQPDFGGHDPVIGQNGRSSGGRTRFIDFPHPKGGTRRISFREEWVVPTGGGYFFAPTISAISDVLAGS